jgi:putative ABC transport system permease protein
MPWWNSIFRKRPPETQLNSELRFHIEELTEANIAAGIPPAEARRRAMLEFGGPEQIKEELRDVHRLLIIDTAVANLTSAFRFLSKSPSFSLTVILTLALAIGANSAVFSAIDAILLRPLPFPQGDQLMRLHQYNPKVASPEVFAAPVRVEDWNRLNSTFQVITGYYVENGSETSSTLPEKVTRAWVAPRFFQVWAIAPALGRDFSAEEETSGGPSVAVISDRFWRNRFNSDPSTVGRKLRIDGYAFTIVGVMPASFLFAERDVDLWSPVPLDAPYAQDRKSTWYTVIGRLKPGVTATQAQANLATVQAQLARQFPETDSDLTVGVEPLKEKTVGGVRSSLWLLFGSVTLLLLIACTNIIALLLARATQRQHEISVRFSLGASRGNLIAQLLTESFVLALLGSLLGLFLAAGASDIFRALARDLPRLDEIHLDSRIVLYSLACSVLATLFCGLIPALRGTRSNISGSLSQISRTQVSGRNSLQWLLVGVQVALAVTLLAGAGLLIRSFQALGRVSPGFDPGHVLTFHVSASWGETSDMKGLTQRIDRTIDSLRSVPGVEVAATASTLPGVPSKYETELKVAEGPADTERKILAETRFVSPGYFAALKVPLLSGEACRDPKITTTPPSSAGLPKVEFTSLQLMVNQSFVNTYLAGSSVIGRHLLFASNPFMIAPGEIRGIVGDAREEGLNREPGPATYWCMTAPVPDPYYLVRTRTAPMVLAETIRKKVRDIEPGRSVYEITTLEEHLGEAFAENRLRTVLLAFFAFTAISLACIGLYGTLSYSVNLRQREVGLRMALGAYPAQITRHFLRLGLGVALAGSVAGWALAVSFTRVLAGMLYGVSPTDLTTLASVVVGVLIVAAAASFIPSFRASRVDPMQVLREE